MSVVSTVSETRRQRGGFGRFLGRCSAGIRVLLAASAVVNDGFPEHAEAFGFSSHAFMPKAVIPDSSKPKLILIGGSPGTGKSTFGMSVALDQGILKCISTDTVRAVMRSFVAAEVSPALHRSSYEPAFEGDDPVRSWNETCKVLHPSVHGLVDDAITRKTSLVVEGVHLYPSRELIDKWEAAGGVALGVLLQVQDPDTHKRLLTRRGSITGHMSAEELKIEAYDRIRTIQDEMMRLAKGSNWLQIEQRCEQHPLEMVEAKLFGFDADTPVTQQMVFTGAPSEEEDEQAYM